MILDVIPVGPLQCNCVILGDPGSGDALVIDPGEEPDTILNALRRHDLECRRILLTHAHIDHIGAVAPLRAALDAEVFLHPADRPLYEQKAAQAQWVGSDPPEDAPITGSLEDGRRVELGGMEGEIIHTPGHSPGGVCLYFESMPIEPAEGRWTGIGALAAGRPEAPDGPRPLLICGDTLFMGSIGRSDLWGGSHDQLIASIRTRLLILPGGTLVVPGHGPATTIAEERESNPFLQ
jgi:glyoxylase-like metal-dependent hydrolase (beta-lactamase superfamily II)